MKKQNVVAAVGLLALATNLLLPGLAFGQDTDTVKGGQGTQVIGCGANPTLTLSRNKMDFDTISVNTKEQYTWTTSKETNAGAGTVAGKTNDIVVIEDNRGAGCQDPNSGNDKLQIAISTQQFYDSVTKNTIPANDGQLRVAVAGTDNDVNLSALPAAYINVNVPSTGTAANAVMQLTNAETKVGTGFTSSGLPVSGAVMRGATNESSTFVAGTSYGSQVAMDPSSTTLLTHEVADINDINQAFVGKTAFGLAYELRIPASQPAGTYIGQLTYTLSTIK